MILLLWLRSLLHGPTYYGQLSVSISVYTCAVHALTTPHVTSSGSVKRRAHRTARFLELYARWRKWDTLLLRIYKRSARGACSASCRVVMERYWLAVLVVTFLALSSANGAAFMGPGEELQCVLGAIFVCSGYSHLIMTCIVDVLSLNSLPFFLQEHALALTLTQEVCDTYIMSTRFYIACINYQSYFHYNISYLPYFYFLLL